MASTSAQSGAKSGMTGGGAFVALVSLVIGVVMTRGTGEIRRCGRTFKFPVPSMSIPIGSRENRATYLTVGRPDFKSLYPSRGANSGWGPAYQWGASYTIQSTQEENVWLNVGVELRYPHLTQFDFLVYVCGQDTCATPPTACPKSP